MARTACRVSLKLVFLSLHICLARPISSGFASIKQKSTLIGLKLLADGKVVIGKDMIDVKKGQTVFFSEEILHSHDWAKKTFNFEGSEDKFIIAEAVHAVAIE